MLDPRQLADVQERLKADDFAKPAHAALYELLATLVEKTGTCDIVTVLDELERQNKRYGLATLCVGGGMGIATIIERI